MKKNNNKKKLLFASFIFIFSSLIFWAFQTFKNITQLVNRDLIVAILDTGINPEQIPTTNRIITPSFESPQNIGSSDTHGHGTRVASIILNLTQKTKILPVKISQEGHLVSAAALAQGIRYALQARAKVINISLGTSDHSSELENSIQAAHNQGVLIITAVGSGLNNPFEPQPIAKAFPQALPHVWVISTLLNWSQALHPERHENFGRQIDLSVLPPFESHFSQNDKNTVGSSYAAAYITGLIAHEIEKTPTLNTYEANTLRMIFRNSSLPLPAYFKWSDEQSKTPRGGYGVFSPPLLSQTTQNIKPGSLFCRFYTQQDQNPQAILHLNSDMSIKNLTYSKICKNSAESPETINYLLNPELEKGLAELKFNIENPSHCSIALTIDLLRDNSQNPRKFEISFPIAQQCIAREI